MPRCSLRASATSTVASRIAARIAAPSPLSAVSIADAMRGSFKTLDNEPIDIGIINAGGIRADLLPTDGKVTVADVFKVQPFSNEVGYVKMTGKQFKTLLEQQWKVLGEKSTRPMLKLGLSKNVKYTFDPAKKMGERITSILIDDKPIDPEKTLLRRFGDLPAAGWRLLDVLKDVKATLKTIPTGLDRGFRRIPHGEPESSATRGRSVGRRHPF